MSRAVLLTGGAGFIGSHTCIALVEAGYDVTILDNFENARRDIPDRLAEILGRRVAVAQGDIRDADAVLAVTRKTRFDAVVHFAGRKSVPESVADPLGYYRSNCNGLINVVAAMRETDVTNIVFSSSAAIYGAPRTVPIDEDTPPAPQNPYAETKLFGETVLRAMARAHPELKTGILRYFNPVGAHSSGLIGEDPSLPPSNLVPVIGRVATGALPKLMIFGGDWPTPDGTGIRDFIHVEDLARGHVLSLEALLNRGASHLVNLGTGIGYSVLEVVRTYAEICGRALPYEIVDRRPGDAAMSYAATARAQQVLGFQARHDLRAMCASNWAFNIGKTARV